MIARGRGGDPGPWDARVAVARRRIVASRGVRSSRGAWQERETVELAVHDGASPLEAGAGSRPPASPGDDTGGRTRARPGIGEASPLPGFSPETAGDAERALLLLGERLAELGRPHTLDDVERAVSLLPADVPSARFALETALLRLIAAERDPALLLAARGSGSPPLAITPAPATLLFSGAPAALAAQAERAVARGARTVKLKLDLAGREGELAGARAVRRAIGPGVRLRLDLNGRSGGDLPRLLDHLAPLEPELVEEPGSLEELAALRSSPVPIAIDESLPELVRSGLFEELGARGVLRAVVLKPMLLGGALAAMRFAALARRTGLEVVVTHLFDGPVSRAAAQALARVVMSGRLDSGLGHHPFLDHWPGGQPEQPSPRPRRGRGSEGPVRAVVLRGDGGEEALAACRAALRGGPPIAPIHPRLLPAEASELGARAAAMTWSLGHAPAAVVFTSGTSGRPKAALLSRASVEASARAVNAHLSLRSEDRWLLSLPLAHVGGLAIVARCELAGATVVRPASSTFDPRGMCEAIDRERISVVSLVPTMLHRLLSLEPAWDPPASLRVMLLGGAGAPAGLLRAAAERGWPVTPTYGLTEAGSMVTAVPLGAGPDPTLGSGVALEGFELRLDQAGVLEVRSPAVMSGYAGVPAEEQPFRPGGWLITGDHAELDPAGRLFVRARRTDLIVRGGENVYPAEVEEVLLSAPGVSAACVVGIPDVEWGELVAAAIVCAPDRGEELERERLLRFTRERLAPHKRPRELVFLAELPLGPTGKLDRAAIRARVRARRPGAPAGP